MAAANSQEERSEKVADTLRALLTTLATAAIGAAYAVSGHTASRGLWAASAIALVASLACTMRSWFVAKDRALARRDALHRQEPAPEFEKSWKASWRWDTSAAWLLILGAVLLACAVAVPPSEQSCYEAARAEAEAAQRYVEAKHPLAESTWQSAYLAAGEWKRKVCPK